MKENALDRFRTEFRRWVTAHNKAKGFTADADDLLQQLEETVGEDNLRHVGSGFMNGWLETERGYFVRETGLGPKHRGQFAITHQGNGKVAPCWELYIQLADYAWLRTVAQRAAHEVRLEDERMDIAVWAGGTLLLYVENKTTRDLAKNVLTRMREYGEKGFRDDEPDRGNDPLRKARYLTRAREAHGHPTYFGLSAPKYRRLFKVEYGDHNHFRLVEDERAFAAVLTEDSAVQGKAPPRSNVDSLANEIEQACPEIWISVGSGKTAYNFYAPCGSGDAVIIGVYKSGEVWTHVAALGSESAERFASALGALGIVLDTEKAWCFWRKGLATLGVGDLDAAAVALAVRNAIDVGAV